MTGATPPPPRPRPIPIGSGQGGQPSVPRDWLAGAPVTRALIGLNVAVFVVQLIITHLESLSHLPAREALAFGASDSLATVGEARWETLVTACFLHWDLLHIGFNMLVLWQAGPLVERAMGSARMAPMYLVAGAAGNALSVAYAWWTRTSQITAGASGAISGVVAAALVVGWRVQGWRGSLTQAMLLWFVLNLAFGLLPRNLAGGHIAHAAHAGGAIAGAAIAVMWRRQYRYSSGATAAILSACTGVVIACIAAVVVHDQTDLFATMSLQDRSEFAREALAEGRCRDAREGLLAVERLRARIAPVTSLRNQVQSACP